jgi:hypothetical protein
VALDKNPKLSMLKSEHDLVVPEAGLCLGDLFESLDGVGELLQVWTCENMTTIVVVLSALRADDSYAPRSAIRWTPFVHWSCTVSRRLCVGLRSLGHMDASELKGLRAQRAAFRRYLTYQGLWTGQDPTELALVYAFSLRMALCYWASRFPSTFGESCFTSWVLRYEAPERPRPTRVGPYRHLFPGSTTSLQLAPDLEPARIRRVLRRLREPVTDRFRLFVHPHPVRLSD